MKEYIKICCMCEKKVKYPHGKRPLICPFCKREWWEKPRTECQLFYLQQDYLKTRDASILTEMYELLKVYARSLVLKILGGKYQMEAILLKEKSHDISVEIISLYLRKPKFKIDKSFGGYLMFKCRQELFGSKNEEDHESLHQIITTKGTDKEIMDALEILGFNSLFTPIINSEFENDQLIQEILSLINRIIKSTQKEIDYIDYTQKNDIAELSIFSLYLLIAIKNKIAGETDFFMNKYYSIFGQEVKKKSEKVLAMIYRILKGESVL